MALSRRDSKGASLHLGRLRADTELGFPEEMGTDVCQRRVPTASFAVADRDLAWEGTSTGQEDSSSACAGLESEQL